MKATLISGCHTRAREPIGQRDVQEYFAHVNFKGTSKTLAGTGYYIDTICTMYYLLATKNSDENQAHCSTYVVRTKCPQKPADAA